MIFIAELAWKKIPSSIIRKSFNRANLVGEEEMVNGWMAKREVATKEWVDQTTDDLANGRNPDRGRVKSIKDPKKVLVVRQEHKRTVETTLQILKSNIPDEVKIEMSLTEVSTTKKNI